MLKNYKSKICKYSGELEIEAKTFGCEYSVTASFRRLQTDHPDGELSLTANGTWSDGHAVIPAEAARELANYILQKLEEA
ncbi:MAG: hypothetical protein ACYS8I_16595 [Planctomycetota bacterium]|jgi:hypothetical protein